MSINDSENYASVLDICCYSSIQNSVVRIQNVSRGMVLSPLTQRKGDTPSLAKIKTKIVLEIREGMSPINSARRHHVSLRTELAALQRRQ